MKGLLCARQMGMQKWITQPAPFKKSFSCMDREWLISKGIQG